VVPVWFVAVAVVVTTCVLLFLLHLHVRDEFGTPIRDFAAFRAALSRSDSAKRRR
jgi:hypothetical protein